MILRLFDRFPGGRLIMLALPIALFLLGLTLFTPSELKQIGNATVMVLSLALCVIWRKSLRIYLRSDVAGLIWLNLAVFLLVVTTVISSAYSTYLDGEMPNDTIVAAIRCAYACSFGALFIAPQATDSFVPPRGWATLVALVSLGIGGAIVGMWLF
jgi:TM2 domain-containing membrane protein YozV